MTTLNLVALCGVSLIGFVMVLNLVLLVVFNHFKRRSNANQFHCGKAGDDAGDK